MGRRQEAPGRKAEQLPKEDRGAISVTPRGSRVKSPMGKSRVRRRWKVETQEEPKVEVEQFLKVKKTWIGRRMETGSID